jgi:acetyltransferase-like isoleucine patch superfamily enzyme
VKAALSATNSVRNAVKRLVHALATIVVVPMLVSFWIRASLGGRDRAVQGSTQALALVPGRIGICLRRAFLARVLPHCSYLATIEFGVLFSSASASVGDYAYIGPYSSIGFAEIGPEVLIASGVQVPSGARTHGFEDPNVPIREQPSVKSRVRIGRNSWIGSNAVVMADVGVNCVIGAGAVVTKPIEDGAVAVGVPARVVRLRQAAHHEDATDTKHTKAG